MFPADILRCQTSGDSIVFLSRRAAQTLAADPARAIAGLPQGVQREIRQSREGTPILVLEDGRHIQTVCLTSAGRVTPGCASVMQRVRKVLASSASTLLRWGRGVTDTASFLVRRGVTVAFAAGLLAASGHAVAAPDLTDAELARGAMIVQQVTQGSGHAIRAAVVPVSAVVTHGEMDAAKLNAAASVLGEHPEFLVDGKSEMNGAAFISHKSVLGFPVSSECLVVMPDTPPMPGLSRQAALDFVMAHEAAHCIARAQAFEAGNKDAAMSGPRGAFSEMWNESVADAFAALYAMKHGASDYEMQQLVKWRRHFAEGGGPATHYSPTSVGHVTAPAIEIVRHVAANGHGNAAFHSDDPRLWLRAAMDAADYSVSQNLAQLEAAPDIPQALLAEYRASWAAYEPHALSRPSADDLADTLRETGRPAFKP